MFPSGIYGNPKHALRRHQWVQLVNLQPPSNHPWIVLGDFNDITHHSEKFGGKQTPYYKLQGFMDMINCYGLIDLAHQGNGFSWCNG